MCAQEFYWVRRPSSGVLIVTMAAAALPCFENCCQKEASTHNWTGGFSNEKTFKWKSGLVLITFDEDLAHSEIASNILTGNLSWHVYLEPPNKSQCQQQYSHGAYFFQELSKDLSDSSRFFTTEFTDFLRILRSIWGGKSRKIFLNLKKKKKKKRVRLEGRMTVSYELVWLFSQAGFFSWGLLHRTVVAFSCSSWYGNIFNFSYWRELS